MKTRIISGLIGFAILLFVVLTGGNVFKLAILGISLVGLFEYHKALDKLKGKYIAGYMNYALSIALFAMDFFNYYSYLGQILFAYMLLLSVHLVFKKGMMLKDIGYTSFGGLYIAFFLSHMYLFEGDILIWLIFIAAWATDTCAYFTGMLLGKHKLCPELSPKKTVEGAVGGVIGATVISVAFATYFKIDGIVAIGVTAMLGSVVSQLGDLTASRIKRLAGIKDYGSLMPGHGGVLDRFDSIIFVAPFIYYSFKIMGLI